MNNRKVIAALLSVSAVALGLPPAFSAESAAQSVGQAGGSAQDATINGKVSAVLMSEPSLMGSKIRVDTNRGVVSLRGTVDAEAAGLRAIELASGVEGVARVESVLTLANR
ncbi:BON domain-containing protein [Cognatazoarcus halotolerans]|uniref:BON domain-containing protein n=1 Tax=Cognatazoarcus halotolerans TaxID=2686016 RepID=UPI00135C694F|nr:BON domain-containing protein [Cognatazoarcus halotolerans]MBX3678990.1 BON domain-containing protein [Rhodocyclaceae bacterium]MCB1898895.1 BON domain-containing protein [Rhodocyclaceae bacterium]MCP5309114.1 BON domain-containing protein [Zoogloeaceae bacterium]